MIISSSTMSNCVLFGLDGMLIDTALDMVNILKTMLREEGHSTVLFDDCRCVISHGFAAMIAFGFGADQSTSNYELLLSSLFGYIRRKPLCGFQII